MGQPPADHAAGVGWKKDRGNRFRYLRWFRCGSTGSLPRNGWRRGEAPEPGDVTTSDIRPPTSELRSPFQRDPLLRCASSAERNTGPMKSPSSAKIRLDHRPQASAATSQSRVRFGGAIVVLVLGRAGAASAKRCTSNPGMFRTMLRSPRKSQVAGTPTLSDISRASR